MFCPELIYGIDDVLTWACSKFFKVSMRLVTTLFFYYEKSFWVLFEKLWYLMIFDVCHYNYGFYGFLGTQTRCDISDPATIKESSQII